MSCSHCSETGTVLVLRICRHTACRLQQPVLEPIGSLADVRSTIPGHPFIDFDPHGANLMTGCFQSALMQAELRQAAAPRCHYSRTTWICRPPVKRKHGKHRKPACQAAENPMRPSDVNFSMAAVRKGSRAVLTELGHPDLLPLVENGELCTLLGLHHAEAVVTHWYVEVRTCCRHPDSIPQAARSFQSAAESLGGSDSSQA